MKLPVYKSLDKTSSLFGIKGSYLYIMIIGIIIAVVVGFGIIGSAAGSIFGTVAALGLGALFYLVVMMIQGKYSERKLLAKLFTFSLPDFIVMQPGRVSRAASLVKFEDIKKKK